MIPLFPRHRLEIRRKHSGVGVWWVLGMPCLASWDLCRICEPAMKENLVFQTS